MATSKKAPASTGASSAKKTGTRKPAAGKTAKSEKIVAPAGENFDQAYKDLLEQVKILGEENTGLKEKSATIEAENLDLKSKLELIPERGTEAHQLPPIVIPFKARSAKANELILAIRSWEKHYPGAVIILVGDTLPQLSDQVLHISHKPVSDNPQIDVASKMAAVIASDLVPEVFIWSNDDIYCMSDILPADIALLKAMPGGLAAKGSAGGTYRQNGDRTRQALKEAGIAAPYDYATHTPVVFEKSKLAETLARFKCTKEGHLVSSLYFNTHYPTIKPVIMDITGRGSVVASVFRANPNPTLLPRIFKTQKWVNNNDPGWPAVKPFLEKLFPDKSAFEK